MHSNKSPLSDSIFKAIFGRREHEHILRHFLNALLEQTFGFSVEKLSILNSSNLRDRIDAKLTIVDVKAVDNLGRLFQIEVQLIVLPSLADRMLFTFCDLHRRQLKRGQDYDLISDTISIWIIDQVMFHQDLKPIHLFQMRDKDSSLILGTHTGILALELPKYLERAIMRSDLDWWTYLLRHGQDFDLEDPESFTDIPEIREAIMIMREFTAEELEEDRRTNEMIAHAWERMIERDMDRLRNEKKKSVHQLHRAILRMHDLGEAAAQIAALLDIPEAEVEKIIAAPEEQ